MSIYDGSIELNSIGNCRIPEVLFHTKQHANDATIPNYGVDQTVPQMYNDFNGTAGTNTVGSVSFPGPTVPIYKYVGECKTSQFIMGFTGTPGTIGAIHTNQDPFNPGGYTGWEVTFGGSPYGNFYARLVVYQYPAGISPPATYFSENYGQWLGMPPSDAGRNTVLVTINPNNSLAGDGPGIGPPFTNGTYPQPGKWPILLNGIPPTDYGYYGSYDGQGATCSSWISNPSAGMYLYSTAFTNTSTMLGFAMFRNQTIFTKADYDCWHRDHDWYTNPLY